MIFDAGGIEVSPEDALFATDVVTLGIAHGKHNTINLCKRAIAEGIPGDFVEAGVNAGGHPALMAYTIRQYNGNGRRVHLYDSFMGVPMSGPEDPKDWQDITGVNPDASKGIFVNRLVSTIEQVMENMRLWKADLVPLVYHPGWLQEVLPAERNTPEQIAVLRIDVDMHDSTVPVFEYLYPKVVSGGYVISDDWGETDGIVPCRKATYAYFDKMGLSRPKPIRLPGTPGTAWWRKP